FFSSRRRHTRCYRDWSSDVCSSDLAGGVQVAADQLVHAVDAGAGEVGDETGRLSEGEFDEAGGHLGGFDGLETGAGRDGNYRQLDRKSVGEGKSGEVGGCGGGERRE